jgi:acid phosphatase
MNMLRRYSSFAIVMSLLGWVSCAAAADVPAGCSAPASPPAMVSFQPNLAVFKAQLLVYRCTSYDNDIELVVQEAQAWVKQRAPQVTNPAIVLDVDETSLSNWRRMYYKDGYPYIPHDACDFTNLIEACGDIDWQWSAQAPAIQPVLDLYKLAQCVDVTSLCTKVDVFFVTGRKEGGTYKPTKDAEEKTSTQWTLENLQKAGFVGAAQDHVYMRPKDSTGLVSDYKTKARITIENGGKVTIIANIGDQESDLVGGHADRAFKLPNPFYLIP